MPKKNMTITHRYQLLLYILCCVSVFASVIPSTTVRVIAGLSFIVSMVLVLKEILKDD